MGAVRALSYCVLHFVARLFCHSQVVPSEGLHSMATVNQGLVDKFCSGGLYPRPLISPNTIGFRSMRSLLLCCACGFLFDLTNPERHLVYESIIVVFICSKI